jgi:hypothetical protein
MSLYFDYRRVIFIWLFQVTDQPYNPICPTHFAASSFIIFTWFLFGFNPILCYGDVRAENCIGICVCSYNYKRITASILWVSFTVCISLIYSITCPVDSFEIVFTDSLILFLSLGSS